MRRGRTFTLPKNLKVASPTVRTSPSASATGWSPGLSLRLFSTYAISIKRNPPCADAECARLGARVANSPHRRDRRRRVVAPHHLAHNARNESRAVQRAARRARRPRTHATYAMQKQQQHAAHHTLVLRRRHLQPRVRARVERRHDDRRRVLPSDNASNALLSLDSLSGRSSADDRIGRFNRRQVAHVAETCGNMRKLADGNLRELPCTSRRSVGCRFGSPGADVARVRFSARHPGADTGFHLLRAAADRPLAGGGEDGLAQRLALAVLQHKPRRHPHGHGPRRRRASARRRRVGRARESRERAGARVAADALDAEHVLGVVRQPLCALRRRGSVVGGMATTRDACVRVRAPVRVRACMSVRVRASVHGFVRLCTHPSTQCYSSGRQRHACAAVHRLGTSHSGLPTCGQQRGWYARVQ